MKRILKKRWYKKLKIEILYEHMTKFLVKSSFLKRILKKRWYKKSKIEILSEKEGILWEIASNKKGPITFAFALAKAMGLLI